jgi:hypothetical protein
VNTVWTEDVKWDEERERRMKLRKLDIWTLGKGNDIKKV